MSYNINIIGGSHVTMADDGDLRNTSFVFLRDGAVYAQDKLHPICNAPGRPGGDESRARMAVLQEIETARKARSCIPLVQRESRLSPKFLRARSSASASASTTIHLAAVVH